MLGLLGAPAAGAIWRSPQGAADLVRWGSFAGYYHRIDQRLVPRGSAVWVVRQTLNSDLGIPSLQAAVLQEPHIFVGF